MTNYSQRSNTMIDGIMGVIKANPEGLLLLAAGGALLMRSGSARSQTRSDGNQHPEYGSQRIRSGGIGDAASETADRARRYVADVGSTVSETAKDYASSIGSYADDAQRAVVDGSEHLYEQARTTVQGAFSRVLKEQPLGLALLGLAAGAAVASVLPRTSVERETLGVVGERVTEFAGTVRENLGEAASQAGEKLKQVADEHGLNSEGLKEAAQEVAGAFGNAFKGEEKDSGKQQSGGRPASTSDISSSRAGISTQPPGGQSAGRRSTNTVGGSAAASGASSGSSGSTASASRPSGESPNPQPQTGNTSLGSPTKRS